MKIWYQSLARESDSTNYRPRLRKVVESACDPGTEVHFSGVHETAGLGVMYHYLRYRDMKEVMENALKAEREGFDAFVIGNFSDSGLDECRELVNIPVLGLCETSMHIALLMGRTFGLVPVSAKQTPDKIDKINRYGFASRFVGAVNMKSSPAGLKQAMIDPALRDQVIADFTAASRELIERGAEVILPAGGEFNIFLVEDGIYEIDNTPVVTGVTELIKMAEFAVKMQKMTGRFTSKRFYWSTPTGRMLERAREVYGQDIYPGAK
jgi:allantoin racemase